MSSLGKKGLTSNQYLVDILCLQHYELKFQTRNNAQKIMIFNCNISLVMQLISFNLVNLAFSKQILWPNDCKQSVQIGSIQQKKTVIL